MVELGRKPDTCEGEEVERGAEDILNEYECEGRGEPLIGELKVKKNKFISSKLLQPHTYKLDFPYIMRRSKGVFKPKFDLTQYDVRIDKKSPIAF